MEVRNRFVRCDSPCSSNSPYSSNSPCPTVNAVNGGRTCKAVLAGPVRKLFDGNKHPYDELAYDYNEEATQAEHRAALLFALSAWIRNGVGACSRFAELAAVCEDNVTDVAQFAIDVCTRVLYDGFCPVATADVIAAGFVTEERFVDPDVPDDEGVTVCELWDWSPFEPLREGKPLAEDEEAEVPPSVLNRNVNVNAPLWLWLTATGFVVIYCWLVALLIGLSIKTA